MCRLGAGESLCQGIKFAAVVHQHRSRVDILNAEKLHGLRSGKVFLRQILQRAAKPHNRGFQGFVGTFLQRQDHVSKRGACFTTFDFTLSQNLNRCIQRFKTDSCLCSSHTAIFDSRSCICDFRSPELGTGSQHVNITIRFLSPGPELVKRKSQSAGCIWQS